MTDTLPAREYLRILRRHKWVVLGITLVCGALAAYKAYTSPPVYLANAVIRLKDNRRAMIGGLMGAAAGGGYGNPVLSQIQVLTSRSVTGAVVDREGLRLVAATADFPVAQLADVQVAPTATASPLYLEFSPEGVTARAGEEVVRAAFGAPISLQGVQFTVGEEPAVQSAALVLIPREVAAAGLLQRLEVTPRQNTDVLDVGYRAHDPVVAQRVANSLVEAFRNFNATAEQQEAYRRRLFIEGQLAGTDSLLLDAQRALTAFRSRERMYSSQEQLASEQAGAMTLEIEQGQMEAELRVYRSLLGNIQRARESGNIEALNALATSTEAAAHPVVGSIQEQLTQYRIARDSLLSGRWRSSAEDPDVQKLNQLIQDLERNLAQRAYSVRVAQLTDQIRATEARLAALGDLRQRRSEQLEVLPPTEAEEVRLLSQVQQVGEAASKLREEYQRARIAEAVEGGQVEIIDEALPGVPVHGGKIRTVLFGLVLGLLFGGGAAVVYERMNTSIRRKDEIEEVLRIPELAVIPRIGEAVVPTHRLRLLTGSANGNGNGKHPPARKVDELVAALQPHTPAAEAYRNLRTNLIFSQSSLGLRRIVVTSSAPSEGKSTTAANLAVTFAQQGMRVLLVDCDLRKARLHKMFGVPREPGFTHLVLKLKEVDEVVHETSVDGLYFLASGTLPPNPAELVGGNQMQEALERLGESFDLVVLDTPPLLAASDAAILGKTSDGVLLVVRAGQTEREAAQQSVRKLTAVGARILGAVLNDPDSRVAQYGGYYVYEYYGSEQ